MSLVSTPLVSDLITAIKQEARVNGSTDLDTMILSIINEQLLSTTENSRFPEFLVMGVPITVVAAQGLYALPADYQNIRTVYFWHSGQPNFANTLELKNDFVDLWSCGCTPRFYEIVGGQLQVWPYDQLQTTDTLVIDYWQQPNALLTTDTWPIPRMLASVKQSVIARLHTYNKDYNAANIYAGSSAVLAGRSQTVAGGEDAG